MKDIVVIFVQRRDARLSAAEPRVAATPNRADELMVDNDSRLPFWTWFIENPRPHSRSVADLLLEM